MLGGLTLLGLVGVVILVAGCGGASDINSSPNSSPGPATETATAGMVLSPDAPDILETMQDTSEQAPEPTEASSQGSSNLGVSKYDRALLDEAKVMTAGVQWLTLKTVAVKQAVYSDKWISLGTYSFPGEPSVYLADNAPETLSRRVQVGFDAVRFRGSGRDVYVDEDRAERGGDPKGWYRATGVGYAGDMLWTYANGGRTDDWMRWKSGLPAGTYEILVFVPRRNAGTTCATYCLQYASNSSAIEQAKQVAIQKARNEKDKQTQEAANYCLTVVSRWSGLSTKLSCPQGVICKFKAQKQLRSSSSPYSGVPDGAWVLWSGGLKGYGHVGLKVRDGVMNQYNGRYVRMSTTTQYQVLYAVDSNGRRYPLTYAGYVTWEDLWVYAHTH